MKKSTPQTVGNLEEAFEVVKATKSVVLIRKTDVGALERPVLGALGCTPTARRRFYRLARAESSAERFFDDPSVRGLTGEGLEMVYVDGGTGLLCLPSTTASPSGVAGRTRLFWGATCALRRFQAARTDSTALRQTAVSKNLAGGVRHG